MSISLFFFFNDTATTEIYTLSLHDALPIWWPYAWITADQPSRQPGAPANVWPRYLTAPVTPPLSWRCSGRVAASALVCPTAPGQPHRSRAHGTCMAARRDGALPPRGSPTLRGWAPARWPAQAVAPGCPGLVRSSQRPPAKPEA